MKMNKCCICLSKDSELTVLDNFLDAWICPTCKISNHDILNHKCKFEEFHRLFKVIENNLNIIKKEK